MIRVKIWGGLGNQLFQYAFAKGIEYKYGLEVQLENTWYKRQSDQGTHRDFILDRLNCRCNLAAYGDTRRCNNVFNEEPLNVMSHACDDTYYVGYWQNPVYFDFIYSSLINEFTLTETEKEKFMPGLKNCIKGIISGNSVSLHVRRTDYLSLSDYPICTVSYYKKGVSLIREIIGNCDIYVFSDDMKWTTNNITYFKECNIHYISTGDDVIDWYLMSLCKHHVIANSTYSWWAARIGGEQGITVMPKNWLHSDNHECLRCKGWINI